MASLTLVEDTDMELYWHCSECGEHSRVTKAIEKDRRCRRCNTVADQLIDEINDDDLFDS